MKAKRKKDEQGKGICKPAAGKKPTKKQVRAELYKPENIEKARRMDRGPIV
ncbi:MAG: hypothetical protein LBH01_10620 [Verrucomicrobiales bacterium]|jgi:hypothetical protein|nr:hypothetical protein [Verrucomicrobiales bacterium]